MVLNLLRLQWILSVYEIPLGISRDFPLFHVSPLLKTVPLSGVQLRQIQLPVMSGS